MPQVNNADEEYLAVLDALALSPDPVFAVNDRHRIIFWNKPMQRLVGFDYDEVVGRSCGATLAGRDQFGNRYCGENCAIFAMTQRGETIHPFRLGVRTKAGASITIEMTLHKFMMRSNRRQLLAYFVTSVDETVAAPKIATVSTDPRLNELTPRELEILGRVAAGQNARLIALGLGISPLTARNHIHKLFAKIEVHSKSEAVAFAYKMHVV
jgi:DNA-binding CsgD family transcriptional regulator